MPEIDFTQSRINPDYLKNIYILAKEDLYYDTVDQFKRFKFAEFEKENFPNKLEIISSQIIDLVNENNDFNFSNWLSSIKINFLPKSIIDNSIGQNKLV